MKLNVTVRHNRLYVDRETFVRISPERVVRLEDEFDALPFELNRKDTPVAERLYEFDLVAHLNLTENLTYTIEVTP